MRIPAPPKRPWELNDEEVSLVKSHVAKGATDEELKFCLGVARRYRLDPFRGQIWFVARNDRTVVGGKRWIPIVGINGMLHIAARDHRDFGVNEEPEFGPMVEVEYQKQGEGPVRKLKAPEWARVKAYKKGLDHPATATVYWAEIYPKWVLDYAPLVRQMPRLMLGKCALAQAIRRIYPATDGLYIQEEFQGQEEFTPEGRQIVRSEKAELPPAEDPSLQSYLSKLTPAERAIEEAALAKKTPAQREVVSRKLSEAKTIDVQSERRPQPVITYTWHENYEDRSQSFARIDKPTFEVMADMKSILRKLIRGAHVEAIGEQLDSLRHECDVRGIELKRRVSDGNRKD